MKRPPSNKIITTQTGTDASIPGATRIIGSSAIPPKVTAIKPSEVANVGNLLLSIDAALTIGCAIGGIIAGLSSIPGIVLLSCAAVGGLILGISLAVSYFTRETHSMEPLTGERKTELNKMVTELLPSRNRTEIPAA